MKPTVRSKGRTPRGVEIPVEEMEFTPPVNDGVLTPGENAARQGKRLDPNANGGGWKLPVLIVAIVAAVLLAAYLGLCAYAFTGHRTLPNTMTYRGVRIGGMTARDAAAKVVETAPETYENMEFPIRVGDRGEVIMKAKEAKPVIDAAEAESRVSWWTQTSFVAAGWRYLSSAFGGQNLVYCPAVIENGAYVERVLDEAEALVGGSVTEATWTVEETEETAQLRLTKGVTGQGIDRDALRVLVMNNLAQGASVPVEIDVTTTPPQEPSFERMAAEVDREPLDAALDVETDEVIPHRLGLKLDPAKAKAIYDTLAEGESGTVELEVTQPGVTTLELRATLFRDILGEGSSKITGDAARVNNVRLSAAACDGIVLLPGQQMSYNQTTGQRTEAKGYREATGYTSKGQELMVGGGVCQPSSTLYQACLHANLEIVNRKNHMYTVSYMPEGIDATVSWPNLDYVFANNTKYPIKISMTIENRVLTARIYGTKTDDTYVKMESVRLSTTPAGVSYEADPEIPRGTTKVVQGAHTGKKVEVYKSTYAGDGTLIRREWVSTDTYRPSDKIIGYNPLDGVPEAGIAPLPDPNLPPVEPAVPTITPTAPPVVEPTPVPPPVVEPSAPPVTPAPSPAVPSVEPGIPTEEPEALPTPTPTPMPPPVDISLLPLGVSAE